MDKNKYTKVEPFSPISKKTSLKTIKNFHKAFSTNYDEAENNLI